MKYQVKGEYTDHWAGRQIEFIYLLSNLELSYFYYLEWNHKVIDIREQFPQKRDIKESGHFDQSLFKMTTFYIQVKPRI